MKIETFEEMKKTPIYNEAIQFIDKLVSRGIPLTAINTNDWECNSMPRVYVTREYGRKQGGKVKGYHVSRLNWKHADKLAFFYNN